MKGLPKGWHYTPTEPEETCQTCGHTTDLKTGTLRAPSGRTWPLVGSKGGAQEREMVKAIVAAHPSEGGEE